MAASPSRRSTPLLPIIRFLLLFPVWTSHGARTAQADHRGTRVRPADPRPSIDCGQRLAGRLAIRLAVRGTSTAMELNLRVLGPLSVLVNGDPVDLGRRRERCLLGVLLLRPG